MARPPEERGRDRRLRQRGIKPARLRRIWRVRTTAIPIPPGVMDWAVRDFPTEPNVVWLRSRTIARMVVAEDQAHGGKPTIDRVQAARCPLCKTWRMGLLAEARRKLTESRTFGRYLPCSEECMQRMIEKESRARRRTR